MGYCINRVILFILGVPFTSCPFDARLDNFCDKQKVEIGFSRAIKG